MTGVTGVVEKFSQKLNTVPPYFPDELLVLYRQRAGLTQGQLAENLGLKSYRAVCNWESATNLPAPDKLKRLIEYYLFQKIFRKDQELQEASRLWTLVKDKFDLTCAINRQYPSFDKSWFTSLLQLQQQPRATKPSRLGPVEVEPDETVAGKIPRLPGQSTRLVGREKEVSELSRLLTDSTVRLVTLLGPGGIGKTRLSLELAYNLLAFFKDDVRLVDLAPVRDTGQVPVTIARSLLLEEGSEENLVERLKKYLSERELLLVLDNFEQVVEAAGFIGELLRETPGLKVIVNSRETLGLELEYVYELTPLALPDPTGELTPDVAAEYGAIKLFADRAARVNPGFRLNNENAAGVVTICRKLEGIPLALELTAGHLRSLSVPGLLELLSRSLLTFNTTLREKPARHRTMRATIEWSYALLKAEEQEIFQLLGLFHGGFTLEVITAIYSRVATRQVSEAELFEILAGLHAKSLVRLAPDGQDRFTMFETIREFALERLKASPEADQTGTIFATYFLEYCEREGSERALKLGQGRKIIEREYRNILAGLDWAIEREQVELALKIGAALGLFWEISAYLTEGVRYLRRALDLPGGDWVRPARGWAAYYAGNLLLSQSNFGETKRLSLESLEIFRQTGDRAGIASALLNLGIVYTCFYDHGPAEIYVNESLELVREVRDNLATARVLAGVGLFYYYRGDFTLARKYSEEALFLEQKSGNQSGVVYCQYLVALTTYRQGNYEATRRYGLENLAAIREAGTKKQLVRILNLLSITESEYRNYDLAIQYHLECLKLNQELGDTSGIYSTYNNLGRIYLDQGDLRKARQHLLKSIEMANQWSHPQKLAWALNNLGLVEMMAGRLTLASRYQKESMEIEAEQKDYFSLAFNLTGQVAVAVRQFAKRSDLSLLKRIATLCGIIETFLETTSGALEVKFKELYDEALEVARQNLPEEVFVVEFGRGKMLSLEEALVFIR